MPRKYAVFIFVFALAGCLLLSQKKALALSSMFPDPNLSFHTSGGDASGDPNNPWPVSATVSKPGIDSSGFNQQLNAPISVIKLYFTQSTGNSVVIEAMCKELQDIAGVRADYKIARTDGNENYDLGQLYFDDYSTNPGTCGGGPDISVGGIGTGGSPLVQSTVSGHQGYYVAVLYVEIDGSSGAGTQSFRVRTTTPGYATFFEQSSGERHDPNARSINAFAMLDKYGFGGSKSQFGIDFAPDCNIGTSDDVWIKWYDADYPGVGNANAGTSFTVTDLNPDPGDPSTVLSVSGAALGGNDEFKSQQIHVKAGHHYRWIWDSVDRNNGIQLWMPFSEINTVVTCNHDPIGDVNDATCDIIWGWAFDPDNYNAQLDIHVYVDGRPGQGGTGFAFTPQLPPETDPSGPGKYKVKTRDDVARVYPQAGQNHGFEIPVTEANFPGFIDDKPHTVYVYAINIPGGNNPEIGSATFGPCAPKGDLNDVNCNIIWGWAFDTDNPTALLDIHVYIDGKGIAFTPQLPPETDPSGPGFYKVKRRDDVAAAYPQAGINHGFEIPSWEYSSYLDGNAHTVKVYAIDTQGKNNPLIGTATLDSAACNPPECSSLQINSASNSPIPQSGELFSVTVGVIYSGGPPPPRTYTIKINFPGATNGVQQATTTSLTHTFNNLRVAALGHYTNGSWTVTYGAKSLDCPGTYDIAAKPYLKVYGNDVAAGGSFADSGGTCGATTTSGNILTYSKVAGTTYTGASAQFAALALGDDYGFFSAGMRNRPIAAPNPPLDLIFGNTNNGTTNVSGASFGGQSGMARCVTDYYDTANPKPAAGNQTIGTTTINNGVHQARYVNGNAYITGTGIRYRNTTWATTNAIPSYWLVVRGDIYIDAGVSQLDGVYVAQPIDDKGNGGHIYTCTNGNSLFGAGSLYASCNTPLVINGSFIANQVKFLRTANSLKDSVSNESWNTTKAAEIFQSTPEMYLAPLPASIAPSTSFTPDFITSLPPIL